MCWILFPRMHRRIRLSVERGLLTRLSQTALASDGRDCGCIGQPNRSKRVGFEANVNSSSATPTVADPGRHRRQLAQLDTMQGKLRCAPLADANVSHTPSFQMHILKRLRKELGLPLGQYRYSSFGGD